MTTCLQCGHDDAGGFAFCPKCGARAVEGEGTGDPLLGRILNGKYRIEREIGSGAMGTVYLGEHISLRKRMALKVLHRDLLVSDESLARFQREGIAAGKFDHPNAIQIFDFDKAEGGIFYLAMEYVDGLNLSQYLRGRGRMPIELAVGVGRQMLSCLAEAHRNGIVHRDFKPENVMVTEGSRGELRVKVLDFGLSKLVDRRLGSSMITQPGRLLGTPLYMSPEQVLGEEADARSDVYAVGFVLYEMLAGQRPFAEENHGQLFLSRPQAEAPSIRADHPDLNLPEELDGILMQAMERERAARFQSAEQMLAALDDFVGLGSGESMERMRARARGGVRPRPGATPPAPPEPVRRRVPMGRLVLIALGAALVAVVLFAVFGDTGADARPARVRLIPAAQRTPAEQAYLDRLDEARAALLAGDRTKAIEAVEQAMLSESRDAEASLVRAKVYRANGDLDSALATYRAAADKDAGFLEARLGLAWLELERDDLEGAAEDFRLAGEIDPEAAEVLAGQGAIALRRGKLDEARSALEQALASDPACSAAQLYTGRLRLDEGDPQGAIDALIQAKQSDSRSTLTLRWLSEAYLMSNRFDEASVQLEDALRIAPDDGDLRVLRGSLLADRGFYDQALEFLEESLKRRADPRLYALRGAVLSDVGRADEAISALLRAVDLGANDPETRCLLGTLYQTRGQLDEARRQYETVLSETGDYPIANLNLGLLAFSGGHYEEAAERLERALAFDDSLAAAHFHLGLLQMNYLGDARKAAEHLRRYQALGGDDPRVNGWLKRL
jgi:tetratricopeptide (TPR) repeat protein